MKIENVDQLFCKGYSHSSGGGQAKKFLSAFHCSFILPPPGPRDGSAELLGGSRRS